MTSSPGVPTISGPVPTIVAGRPWQVSTTAVATGVGARRTAAATKVVVASEMTLWDMGPPRGGASDGSG